VTDTFSKGGDSYYATDPAIFRKSIRSIYPMQAAVRGGLHFANKGQKTLKLFYKYGKMHIGNGIKMDLFNNPVGY
jgi:hypothetical protein